jgi:heat shock protein HslJ
MRAMPGRLPAIPVPIVFAVAMALVLAACDATESSPGGTPQPAPSADLSGTSWVLRAIGDRETVAGASPTLAFEAGEATGTTGCNSFGGQYTIDGASLVFSPLATTKRACEPALMDQETAVLDGLAGVTAWEVGGDGSLRLSGEVDLVFDPVAR